MRLPAARWVVMTIALLLASPAGASRALDGLLACRRIAGSAARLACFDRESAAVAARMAKAVRPRPAVAGSPPKAPAPGLAGPGPGGAAAHSPALDPRQTFGLPPGQILAREEAAQRAPAPLDHIQAHIVTLANAGDGREIFTLDNHQVWKEVEPDGDLYAKPGEAVEISRGWLGSYSLSLKSRRSSKVLRLR